MSLTKPATANTVRNHLETVRSRFFYKSLDAAMTASLAPRQPLLNHIKAVLDPRSANYDRVISFVNLVDTAIPGVSKAIARYLYSPGQLPFAGVRPELMNYGSGSTVSLLRGKNGYQVLKVYRQSLGKGPGNIMPIATFYKRKYMTVSSWYNGRFQLVPPATFFILHGPILGRPAVAVLQPYIHGLKKDFFKDFTDEQLVGLMKANDNLRDQFVFFAGQTIDIYKRQGLCLDFLGRDNLMLVENEGEVKIVVIDNGIFDIKELKEKRPFGFSRIEKRMTRLKLLLQETKL